MAGLGSGAVVEVRDVVGGRLVFGVLVGSHLDAVSCFGPLPGGCGHSSRGSPAFRCVVRSLLRGPRSGPGAPFLLARGSFSDRYGCKGRASLMD